MPIHLTTLSNKTAPSQPASTTENPAKRRASSGPDSESISPHTTRRPPPSDWRQPPPPPARAPVTWTEPRIFTERLSAATDHPGGAPDAGAPDEAMSMPAGSSTTGPATTAEPASRAAVVVNPAAASSNITSGGPYVRRKRALAACQFCRLRKTKCDNVRPVCGSCRHHQARCVYTDGSEGDGSQVGLDEAASRHREVLERLADIQSLLARQPSMLLSDAGGARSSGAASEMGGSVTSALAGGGGGNSVVDCESNAGVGGGGAAVETESAVPDYLPSYSSSATAYLQYTKCESILKWPVFVDVMTGEDAEVDSFIFDEYVRGDDEEREERESVFMPARESASPASVYGGTGQKKPKTTPLFGPGVRDQAFVTLSHKFLALVNCRNPILDAHDLLSFATSVAEDGLDWDAKSCIVLLACALASYSRAWTPPPYVRSAPSPSAARRDSTVPPDVMSASDDDAAKAYYEAAQRRFGSLGSSLIDVQCFYFASLFERFAFRPLQAWMYLQQAATRLRLHHMQRRGQDRRRRMTGQDDSHMESGPSTISYHLEQRAFWSIHKAEREFATELGIALASDLTGLKYPAAFPTPPETLKYLIPNDDGDDGDISDLFSPRRNEFILFFYLAEISLRRTFDEVLSVVYEKGEQNWIENIDLVCRQYYESEKQICDWQSHLPRTMRWDPASQPINEMAYYLESRFEEWNEYILRPLAYYCLHYPPTKPPTPSIVALAQRDMTLCVNCIMRCANYDRHGGTWLVLRRTFRCTLIILAAVIADGPLRPPENWQELTRISIATLTRWSVGVQDLQRMRKVLERVFRAVCETEATRMSV